MTRAPPSPADRPTGDVLTAVLAIVLVSAILFEVARRAGVPYE